MPSIIALLLTGILLTGSVATAPAVEPPIMTSSIETTVTTADNDQGAPTYTETGSWFTSGSTGYNGGTYRYRAAGTASTATWTANLTTAGKYKVEAVYHTGGNRADLVKYNVSTSLGIQSAYANQQAVSSLTWGDLGTYTLNAGVNTITLDAGASTPPGNICIADTVRWTLVSVTTPAIPSSVDDWKDF